MPIVSTADCREIELSRRLSRQDLPLPSRRMILDALGTASRELSGCQAKSLCWTQPIYSNGMEKMIQKDFDHRFFLFAGGTQNLNRFDAETARNCRWKDQEHQRCWSSGDPISIPRCSGASKPALGTVGKTRRFTSATQIPPSTTNRMGWKWLEITIGSLITWSPKCWSQSPSMKQSGVWML